MRDESIVKRKRSSPGAFPAAERACENGGVSPPPSWTSLAADQAEVLLTYLRSGGDDPRFVTVHATAILQAAGAETILGCDERDEA